MKDSETGFTTEWPFDFDASQIQLSLSAIEQQANYFLFSARETGDPVAFIGSGVSMAYGRVTWGELSLRHMDSIRNACETFKVDPARSKADTDKWSDTLARIDELQRQLEALRPDAEAENNTSSILAMQMAEQVWRLVLDAVHSEQDAQETEANKFYEVLLEGVRSPLPSMSTRVNTDNSDKSVVPEFRDTIKDATYDEVAHIRTILSNPFDSFTPNGSGDDPIHEFAKNLKHKYYPRFREKVELQNPHELFAKSNFKLIKKAFMSIDLRDNPSSPSLAKASAAIANRLATVQMKFAKPIHYHYLGLLIDSYRLLIGMSAAPKNKLELLAKEFSIQMTAVKFQATDEKRNLIRERTQVVDSENDPLWLLHQTLGVRRFVTTNYDLEVERLMADLNFRLTNYPPQSHLEENLRERIHPGGDRAREIVLGKTPPGYFIDFAASDDTYAIEVTHLHGRSTDGDNVVITDPDYQKLYIGTEPQQLVMREGLRILHGGNPIIFVGLGLSEGDVMRPLREFVATDLARNRAVVALMPAMTKKSERNAQMVRQLIGNGVYIIYYGDVNGEERTDTDEKPTNWVFRVSSYIDKLIEITRALKEAYSKEDKVEFDSKIRQLQPTCDPDKPDTDSIFQTMEKLRITTLSNTIIDTDGGAADARVELSIINEIKTIIQYGVKYAWFEADKKKRKYIEVYLDIVIRRALERSRGAVFTIALSAFLRGLPGRQTAWRSAWRGVPNDRIRNLKFNTENPAEDVKPWSLTRWLRTNPVVEKTDNDDVLNDFFQKAAPISNSVSGRLFVVAGPRGTGKGAFVSSLVEKIDTLLGGREGEPPRRYAGVFFANLAFSCEVSSVWDSLIAFLNNPEGSPEKYFSREDALNLGRIRTLRSSVQNSKKSAKKISMKLMKEPTSSLQVHGKFAFIFQSLDVLLDDTGTAKNSEISQILDLLISLAEKGHDVIFSTQDNPFPRLFRHPALSPDSDHRPQRNSIKLKLMNELDELSPSGFQSVDRMKVYIDPSEGMTPPLERKYRDAKFRIEPPAGKHGRASASENFEAFLYLVQGSPRKIDTISQTFGTDAKEDLGKYSSIRYRRALIRRILNDLSDRHSIEQDAAKKEALFQEQEIVKQKLMAFNRIGDRSSDKSFIEIVLDYWGTRSINNNLNEKDLDEKAIIHLRGGREVNCKTIPFKSALNVARRADVQRLVLRHLALISIPVDARTLRSCKEISATVRSALLREEGTPKSNLEAATLISIECALLLLAARGLAFRIGGHNTLARRIAERFQVHRSVQLVIFRQLGAQETEPSSGYSFTMSTYVSQTRKLPILSANAYALVHGIQNELVRFDQHPSELCKNAEDTESLARDLRAALGISRTLFSIGVISRFAELSLVKPPGSTGLGFLEHHRRKLQWMIQRATQVGIKLKHFNSNEWNPFYSDETVWLFNECGVLALAEGRVRHANINFQQAHELLRKIEGAYHGPHGRRVALNQGICALEMGKLQDATYHFNAILTSTAEHEDIRLLAEGYLAVIDHIEGQFPAAKSAYEKVLEGLERLGRNRALSIFRRHFGGLLARMGDKSRAQKETRAAIEAAERAGIIDAAHMGKLQLARLLLAEGKPGRMLTAYHQSAETYAVAMGMPRLQADVHRLRADILLAQGETVLAADNITTAIQIATLNGLALRSLNYRQLLAKIHIEAGHREEGENILDLTLQSARRIGYMSLSMETEGAALANPAA